MSYEIRLADMQQDRSLLTHMLSHHLNPDAAGPRFNWLYEENPHGRAEAWIAVDSATGKAVGAAAAFPRKLHTADGLQPGCVFGDFCIDPRHRSLGLALRLQRACLDHGGSASCGSAYDFPSTQMMAIYTRMRIPTSGQMMRWAKLLRVDRVAARAVRSAWLGQRLAGPLNKLLRWKSSFSVARGAWRIEEHSEECGDEFSALARNIGPRYGTCVDRSAVYLNWRYRKHPLRHHEMLTARRNGTLAGYVVFSHGREDATIMDLFGLDNDSLWAALVAEVVTILHSRGVVAVSASTLISDPRVGALRKLGFRARESCPVIIYGRAAGQQQCSDRGASWLLMDGDRDT
jgi:hypothetical protein